MAPELDPRQGHGDSTAFLTAPEDAPSHRKAPSASPLPSGTSLTMIGTLVVTILLAADFIQTVLGVVRDRIPAMALLRSLVYLFASLGVTAFFYVFRRAQSR